MWSGNHSQPLPKETKTDEATQEEKLAHLIGGVFDRMLDMAIDRRGLPRVNGDSDDFDLSTVLVPRRHRAGNIREALFRNGLWLRATTAGSLTDSLHSLLLYTNGRPHEYHVVGLNVDSEVDPAGIDKTGIEEIATVANISHDLGKIQSTFEIEGSNRWPKALTLSDLTYARQSRDKSR